MSKSSPFKFVNFTGENGKVAHVPTQRKHEHTRPRNSNAVSELVKTFGETQENVNDTDYAPNPKKARIEYHSPSQKRTYIKSEVYSDGIVPFSHVVQYGETNTLVAPCY